MTEMVERGALAIFESDVAHGICGNTWAEESEGDKQLYREDARRVIEAIREPTEEMIIAGCRHENMGDMAGRWQAMIDAALTPSSPIETEK